jgi:predicted dehydrogenase
MPPLRVAVIGTGAFGRNHLRVYRELEAAHPDLVQLAALVEPDPARREPLAAQYNVPAFASVDDLLGWTTQTLSSPPGVASFAGTTPTLSSRPESASFADAVERPAALPTSPQQLEAFQPQPIHAASICVPTIHHAAVAAQLLTANIDLLIEKPFAATLDEADHLITLARERHRILAVGHLERFNPAVTATMAALNKPMFFEAHRLSIFTPRSLDVDVVLDLMIHDLDIVLALTQSPVTEVRAVGLPVLSRKTDIANVRVEFASGCVANFTASRVSTEQVRKLRLFQPHQYLSLDFARQELLNIAVDPSILGNILATNPGTALGAPHLASEMWAAKASNPPLPQHPSPGLTLSKSDIPKSEPLRLELEDFLQAVRTRTPPRVPAEAGRAALALALEINHQIAAHAHRAGLT